MERIEYSIDIDHAVEEVFCFIARPENEPKWRNGLATSEATSEGPMKVGSTGRRVQSFLGRKMENDWTVTELTPNSRIARHQHLRPDMLQLGLLLRAHRRRHEAHHRERS